MAHTQASIGTLKNYINQLDWGSEKINLTKIEDKFGM